MQLRQWLQPKRKDEQKIEQVNLFQGKDDETKKNILHAKI